MSNIRNNRERLKAPLKPKEEGSNRALTIFGSGKKVGDDGRETGETFGFDPDSIRVDPDSWTTQNVEEETKRSKLKILQSIKNDFTQAWRLIVSTVFVDTGEKNEKGQTLIVPNTVKVLTLHNPGDTLQDVQAGTAYSPLLGNANVLTNIGLTAKGKDGVDYESDLNPAQVLIQEAPEMIEAAGLISLKKAKRKSAL